MTKQSLMLWDRARNGQSSVVVGLSPTLEIPKDLKVLRINCAFPWTAGGPLHKAYQQLQEWLGEGESAQRQASPKDGGLRYQLLGEMPLHLTERGFAAACKRLGEATEGRTVLLFEAAEYADEAIQSSLLHLLGSPETLTVPWILVYHSEPEAEAAALLDKLREIYGDDIFFDESKLSAEETPSFAWSDLPQDVMRVLRAGAVMGSVFESELVALLLGLSHVEVLEGLQTAVDYGVPLGDYGDNRFFLPPESVEHLNRQMLPSLLAHWHETLAKLLAGQQVEDRERAQPSQEFERIVTDDTVRQEQLWSAREEPGEPVPAEDTFVTERGPQAPRPRVTEPEVKPSFMAATDELSEAAAASAEADAYQELVNSYVDLFAPQTEEPMDEVPRRPLSSALASEEELPFGPPERDTFAPPFAQASTASFLPGDGQASAVGRDRQSSFRDQFRAAAHLHAAGRPREALLHYLAAAGDASAAGDTRLGIYATQQASELLGALPQSAQRSVLEAQVLVEMARLKWHGAIAGSAFTLQDALATVETARQVLPATAPLELAGKIVATYAGISNDLGNLPLLQQALQELSSVSRRLLAASQPVQAVRLLNDQAALYIRLGDPLQASHLLFQTRELFENMVNNNPQDIQAREELADTEHLLARLPLHAHVMPNREYEAYTLALRHTERADSLYQELGQLREQARVWTTKGKLELGRKHTDVAERTLLKAIQVQRQIGDLTGLARTNAALADLFTTRGQFSEALALLGESTLLNLEKGAPLGIAFNQRTLKEIQTAISKTDARIPPHIHEQIQQLEQLITHAESLLGQVRLPDDSRDGLLHATF